MGSGQGRSLRESDIQTNQEQEQAVTRRGRGRRGAHGEVLGSKQLGMFQKLHQDQCGCGKMIKRDRAWGKKSRRSR